MKKIFSYLMITAVALSICWSCSSNSFKQIQTGDLLFIGIPFDYDLNESDISGAIASSTGDGLVNYIHTAIFEVEGDSLYIVDATLKHGVARYPFSQFKKEFTLKDGSLPRMEVMRLNDNSSAEKYVENAKKFIGEEYDVYFLHGNDRHYCTELVYDSYLDEDGNSLFQAAPMNFKNSDGEFPVYWEELFAILGQPIPQDEPGTNPAAMINDPVLVHVTSLE